MDYTNQKDIDGNKIYNGDTVETVCMHTKLEVYYNGTEWCLRNDKVNTPFREFTHSVVHSDRLNLRKV